MKHFVAGQKLREQAIEIQRHLVTRLHRHHSHQMRPWPPEVEAEEKRLELLRKVNTVACERERS